MNFRVYSHRNALTIFENDEQFEVLWREVVESIHDIPDEELIYEFENSARRNIKSLSEPINILIDRALVALDWSRQSPIFNDPEYLIDRNKTRWTLDFAKDEIAIEVAFNHGEAVAWNLLKPVLSSELNHVEKAIQTTAGIVITATNSLKVCGNFDNAAGTYEKFLRYLNPLMNVLTIPMVIIGLEAPESFRIDRRTREVILREHNER